MSKFLVLGAGKMGVVLAKDLIDSSPDDKVTLVDINSEQLERARKFIGSIRLNPVLKDIENIEESFYKEHDVVLCALLHKQSFLALKMAVQAGVHYVDLVGEAPLERLKYDQEARQKGITLISGIGVSPGISNACAARAVHLLDKTEKLFIYCGGNPIHPKPPLNYRIVYAVNSLLNFYEREVPIIKEGKEQRVSPLSGIEPISFPPDFPEMECFYTDGLNSLFYTLRDKVLYDLAEKTVRYKGHAEGINTLKDCGLFSKQPLKVNGQQVIPRRVLEILLDLRMNLGEEKDATLIRVIASGQKSGKAETHIFEMIDFYDQEKKYTSMAKTTSFPASITAQLIISGKITKKGSMFPEDVFHDDLFLCLVEELKKRGVLIIHSVVSN